MATTTSDEGFHEIQLNGKQLVFLFMAVTVVSVVIFLCGVLVGRGVRGDGPDALTAQESAAPGAPDAVAAAAPAGGASAPASEELSYPNRLASAEPAPEQLRETPPPAPREEPVPAAPPPTAAPAAASAAAGPSSAASRTAVAPAVAAPVIPPPASSPPGTVGEPAGAGYAIQLAALSKREEADGIARRLTGKGYPAYVLSPDAGAPAVFRVRVGKFKDRREAESVRARLQKEEQFNPWIVR